MLEIQRQTKVNISPNRSVFIGINPENIPPDAYWDLGAGAHKIREISLRLWKAILGLVAQLGRAFGS